MAEGVEMFATFKWKEKRVDFQEYCRWCVRATGSQFRMTFISKSFTNIIKLMLFTVKKKFPIFN